MNEKTNLGYRGHSDLILHRVFALEHVTFEKYELNVPYCLINSQGGRRIKSAVQSYINTSSRATQYHTFQLSNSLVDTGAGK